MSNEYKPTYVDNTDNSISTMESTDTISFCKTGTKINTLSAKNVAHKKTGEDLNLCAFNNSNFNPVIKINNNHSDCRIMTNLNVSGNINITNPLSLSSGGTGIGTVAKGDIFYASDNNTLTKLPAGSNGQILTIKNEIPYWSWEPLFISYPVLPVLFDIPEEWIIGGYNGTGISNWNNYEYNSNDGVTASSENNKSWHLFTQWTQNPALGSGTYEYGPNNLYNHYNYSNNGLTLSFNDNNFPNNVSYPGPTPANSTKIDTVKPFSFITKKNYYDGSSIINFTGDSPGGSQLGSKQVIFNFNKFMYLTYYEICGYIWYKTQAHNLYYLDEDNLQWVIIHEWIAKRNGIYTSTTASDSGFVGDVGNNTNGTANVTQNPLVDLTQSYTYNGGTNPEKDPPFQKVTPQIKPARTYLLIMEDTDTHASVYTPNSNGGYFSLLKGKIIY